MYRLTSSLPKNEPLNRVNDSLDTMCEGQTNESREIQDTRKTMIVYAMVTLPYR